MQAAEKIIDISDQGLLQSLKKNNHTAFKEIYKRHWSKLYIFALNILHDKDLCEEVIQEVFVTLWERRNSSVIENLSAYLYQAVRYQVYKQFRKSKMLERESERFDSFLMESDIEESVEYLELQSKITESIAKLPDQRRLIFQLSRVEELSNKEIAGKLNLSVQTVKNQITKAIGSLRRSLKDLYLLF